MANSTDGGCPLRCHKCGLYPPKQWRGRTNSKNACVCVEYDTPSWPAKPAQQRPPDQYVVIDRLRPGNAAFLWAVVYTRREDAEKRARLDAHKHGRPFYVYAAQPVVGFVGTIERIDYNG